LRRGNCGNMEVISLVSAIQFLFYELIYRLLVKFL
jgi:hypothetical protein